MGVSLTYQGLKHGDHRLQKVMIDKIRVQQILINLIQNAIKFSRSGDKVQVTVDEYVVDDYNNFIGVNIRVTD
jgi:signal transduction histidine kinase